MLRKLLLSALTACMASLLTMQADEPFRLHRYDSFQATPVTSQSIVFVGNSITNMQPWAELFGTPDVVNRGNSGGFSWEILANVQSYITRRPAKVFIMIGTNDMNVAGYTPEAVVKNVRQTVKHIQKESPKTQVYIESVMPSTNGSRTVAKGQELNRQLKAMAEDTGVTYVDYFDALMGCTDGTMSYDNLHPHVTGTRAWTSALAAHVGGEAVLPANPVVNNGGQQNSYGARASVFGQLPVTSDDVLFIGDEFVHSGEWQELLGNANVKNRGTGWGKWGPNLTYQTACVPFILKGLEGNAAPKQVLLMIGTQNLTSSSSDKEAFKANYDACIEAIRAYAPDTRITLVSEIPYGPSATSLNVSNLVPINQWLKEKAEATDNMDYCDLYSVLTDDNNAAIAKYLNSDQYVTGLGYQACARELAKHIEGCTVMGEEEAEAYYNIVAARRTLSNAIDAIELNGSGIDVEPYYALLANDDATVTELEAAAAALDEALKPGPGKWYTLTAKRNTSVFFTKATGGNGFIASTTLSADGNSYWQLTAREDGTYDLCNGAGYYAVPTATHNVQLNLSQSKPGTGWSLESCDASGAYNVTAKVGSATVNCCMNLTGQNTIYNWITGRTGDQGCQVVFAEAEYEPAEMPDTYNVPFKPVAMTGGEMTGTQWWYTMKLKGMNYLHDNGEAAFMALDRTIATGEADEQWAFSGSDQKGYTIYNRKYGRAKVLAAPATIGADNGSTYVTLVDANAVPEGYETRWQFAASTAIEGAYYMYQYEQPTHAVNNYGGNGKLSFWLGGKDAGSSIEFGVAEAVIPIGKDYGTTYRNGAETTSGWVSQWRSAMTDPFQVTFGTTYNNMNAATLGIAVGSASGAWTFGVSSQDYYVHSYSFDIKAGDDNQVVTPADGEAVDIRTTTFSTITWHNDDKGQKAASFTFTGANKEATVQNMTVTVRPVTVAPEPQVNVFEYGTPGNTVCYRIPAIATAHNGDVIAVADYRYGGADIGFGRVSLHARISKDNGATWGDKIVVAESHQGQYGVDKANDLEAGFGDPAIVADRESDNVLLLSCCGNVSYPGGTWAHHQGIARFRSTDNGATWSKYEDMSPHIYQQFKDAGVDVQALFIGSGRVFQSRFTKIGQYYRLYAVCLLRTSSQGGLNYVLYSDDFGETWAILGDDATPGVTSGDEPKAEELPDGSILLSSRTYGRIFNIFSFTDVEKGEGRWGKQAWSDGNATNGTVAQGNSCNGEIMILPVVRQADSKKMWLALQSVPFGPSGRYNVGIYYKGLASYADFATPTAFANNWEGRHQASFMSSAYSTMTLQHDNTVGFLYEEDTFGRSYTIVYKNYSIETITDSLYRLDTEAIDPFKLTADGVEAKTAGLTFSPYVGGIKESEREVIDAAIGAFKASPCAETYLAINRTVEAAERVPFDPTVQYIVRNTARGTAGSLAMSVPNATTLKLAGSAYNKDDGKQRWSFIPAGDDGTWRLYNSETGSWVMNTLAVETDMYTTADATKAGTYRITGQDDRLCLLCTTPAAPNYPVIHLPGNTARMVCWTASADASQWWFEATDIPADDPTGITPAQAMTTGAEHIYDLQGRAVTTPHHGLYIVGRRKVAY